MPKMSEHNGTINIVGSEFRDDYRFKHKQNSTYETKNLRNICKGLDIDFVEMRCELGVCYIAAFTDIKKAGDDITWMEEKAYQILDKIAPVLIIEADEKFTEFKVHRFNREKILTLKASDYWNTFLPNIEDFIKRDLK